MPKRSEDVPEIYAQYERDLGIAIGRRIRDRRQQLSLNQDQVRARLELRYVYITRSQYSRIETGETLPRASEIIALTQALDVSCMWLLFGKDAK